MEKMLACEAVISLDHPSLMRAFMLTDSVLQIKRATGII